MSKSLRKIRKVCQLATIPHGDVIKERSALRFEGKGVLFRGCDCGHEVQVSTVFVLGPSVKWKKEGKRERCVNRLYRKGKEKENGDV